MKKKFNLTAEAAQTILDAVNANPEWKNICTVSDFYRNWTGPKTTQYGLCPKDTIKINVNQEYVELYTNKADEYKGRRADYLIKNPAELDKLLDWVTGN